MEVHCAKPLSSTLTPHLCIPFARKNPDSTLTAHCESLVLIWGELGLLLHSDCCWLTITWQQNIENWWQGCTDSLWRLQMQCGNRAAKRCLITQWMTHSCDHSSNRLYSCNLRLSHKHRPIQHVGRTTAQPQPVHHPHHQSLFCPPVNTVILHRTCAVAVNNKESSGGELVILLTLSLNHSLSLPSVMQCSLATAAEQFKRRQRPGLA